MQTAVTVYFILASFTVATTTADVGSEILGKEGSLALQVALLIAVASLGAVIVTLHRVQTRADKARYDSLMVHHQSFAEDVRKERGYWQETMVTVIRDNTKAMASLSTLLEDGHRHCGR
jgi:hypothetical protein